MKSARQRPLTVAALLSLTALMFGLVPLPARSPPAPPPPCHADYWNNNGDKAVLYDAASHVVDSLCYKSGCP